ncbi:MAG: hypothetical protein J5819_08925 [Eubacterium sp.]|nr:hypothetical protein [Eubacterium sp.]
MEFKKRDFERYQRAIGLLNEEILLPKNEYALLLSELNTNMTAEDRMKTIVTKPIGNYYYTVINKGYNDYTVIGKRPIVDYVEEEWED